MPVEAIAGATFVGLFVAWVILPSRLRKAKKQKPQGPDGADD